MEQQIAVTFGVAVVVEQGLLVKQFHLARILVKAEMAHLLLELHMAAEVAALVIKRLLHHQFLEQVVVVAALLVEQIQVHLQRQQIRAAAVVEPTLLALLGLPLVVAAQEK